jgi:DNA-binding MarR family transcriptional regulator
MTKTPSDEALAAEWHALMGRYHRLSCELDRELSRNHGVSVSEFEVLQELATSADGSMRMHDLGENIHLTQSALSRLVAKLEGEGLLERSMCEEDRRSIYATVTADGRKRFEDARPTQRAILRSDVASRSKPTGVTV